MEFLWGLLAGFAAAALLASYWQAKFIGKPISTISRAVEDLAGGRHDARVHLDPREKFGPLAATVNLLAERFQHDISELRRLEQVRKEFVANASHELRTPLAAIQGFAETLAEVGVEDAAKRAEFIGEIEKNAQTMARLVDDLLEISALESGRMPPIFEPISVMKAAAEVTASLKPLAGKKKIVLRLEPSHDIAQVRADKAQLKQVFTNLLDNAIKFTPDNGTIHLWAEAQRGQVTVTVQDTGIGIPAKDLPRIFERFYRVDKARSRELGGTGLGLSIVKHIVEQHGGSVAVESEVGKGSSFRVAFPALGS